MRRVASFVFVCLTLATLGSAASAAEPVRVKFYTFGENLVNGSTRAPSLDHFAGREPAKFERMLKLRKDMTGGIFDARKDRTFK